MFNYDVLVVGAGHAGIEAALASARLGLKTAIFTINLDNIGVMSCNPSIGGPAKGHLVREIDALGGEMGRNTDKSFLQIRTLNTRKGPAVQATRAQADKLRYNIEMKKTLENQKNLDVIQAMITNIVVEDGKITGIKSKVGIEYFGKSVIIATGTFMNGLMHIGEKKYKGGRMGELSSDDLPGSLKEAGLELRRFKTGTPPRLNGKTINYEKTVEQPGDIEKVLKFSKRTKNNEVENRKQLSCYITFTNNDIHNLVLDNLDRAPLFNGSIDGVGPRYCPSIEDKIVRYKEKDRHQVFLEPEGYETVEIYANGLPTSLPTDIQEGLIQGIDGLENCKIMRYGYAIEYDYILPEELRLTLETKKIDGLFLAGQINGTSGYEEAASQGLIAGINAAMKIKKRKQIILDRSNSYIGTLIDDLVTKGTNEPYRMFTARSEYRLILREDNADLRLSKIGYDVGLISEKEYKKTEQKRKDVKEVIKKLDDFTIGITNEQVKQVLNRYNEPNLKSGTTLKNLLKRPKFTFKDIKFIEPKIGEFDYDTENQIEVQVKYEGYIKKQERMIKRHKQLEEKELPENFDYTKVKGLTKEAQDKLNSILPNNIGQASRISGVSPADISVLLMNIKSGAIKTIKSV